MERSSQTQSRTACDLSLVVPAFNEKDALPTFHRQVTNVLKKLHIVWEIIYVDDGSDDGSYELLEEIRNDDQEHIGVLHFSRNFGKEKAISAGLKVVNGEAVIIIDADMQDPPDVIPLMVDAWRKGADIVNMHRSSREGDTYLKRKTAQLFYSIFNKISDIYIPHDVSDFRLLSRRAVDSLNQLPEENRFAKGLFAWLGYKQIVLEYKRVNRVAGITKWGYWKLWNYAIDGILAFSSLPLRIATYIGMLGVICSLFYATFALLAALFGSTGEGYSLLLFLVLFIGSIQLIFLGMIGEYLWRMSVESRRRPPYLIDKYTPPQR